jgi:hypothetical protein
VTTCSTCLSYQARETELLAEIASLRAEVALLRSQRRYSAKELVVDRRVAATPENLRQAERFAAAGWSPEDVTALLDEWPTVPVKGSALLATALGVAQSMPPKGPLAGQPMPPVVVRAWLKMLWMPSGPADAIIAPAPSMAEFVTRAGGGTVGVFAMIQTWNRTTLDPYLAVIAGGTGMPKAEFRDSREQGLPTLEALITLASLRTGITFDPQIIEAAKVAL